MVIHLLEVEPTPNPNAYKFVTDQELLPEGKKLNVTEEEKDTAPDLIKGLFDIETIETVLITENFVSVSGTLQTDWDIVQVYLERHLSAYDKAQAETYADSQKETFKKQRADIPQSEMRDQVEDLLDTYVRPALAGDGGGVELMAIDGNIIYIRYQGACGSCPTSTQNTLGAIQNLMRTKINPEIVLEPA